MSNLNISELLSNIKVILFDLDDTLIDSEKHYAYAYQKLSLNIDQLTLARNLVKAQLPLNHVSARNRALYFKKYLELTNNFSVKKWKVLLDDYENTLNQSVQSQMVNSDSIRILSQLSQKFSLGLVSNENLRTQLLKLQHLDPDGKIFKALFISEEFGVEKPNEKIIQASIDHWKLLPSQILMIGDSVSNDLIPFSKAGCRILGTYQFRDERELGKNFHWISSLSELLIP